MINEKMKQDLLTVCCKYATKGANVEELTVSVASLAAHMMKEASVKSITFEDKELILMESGLKSVQH